jgi:hypothetical protein
VNFFRTFLDCCRTNKSANLLHPTGSRITSSIAIISASGLVFASAGFGAVYAWIAGAVYGWLMAGLMVLMACALECAKPWPWPRPSQPSAVLPLCVVARSRCWPRSRSLTA